MNPMIPADAQNGGQGANNNNPLGFIGRLFGPPPGIADLAANRQMPQNQGQPGAQVAGQGNGVFVNYQVQRFFYLPVRQKC